MEDTQPTSLETPAEVYSNPFKVAVGDRFVSTDSRRPRTIEVVSIGCGRAKVECVGGRTREIRLDRFSPSHHLTRLVNPS